MKLDHVDAALSMLTAAALVLSACGSDKNPAPAYAASTKVHCGGK